MVKLPVPLSTEPKAVRDDALEKAAQLCRKHIVHDFSPHLSQYVIFPGIIEKILALKGPKP